MTRPPAGLCLPCEFVKARDGDTIEVSLRGSERVWAIRLIDCWCAETRTRDAEEKAKGLAAKAFAESLISQAAGLHVFIPAPADIHNLLKNITFDRIPGYIYLDGGQTLNELMVFCGHASKAKGGPVCDKRSSQSDSP